MPMQRRGHSRNSSETPAQRPSRPRIQVGVPETSSTEIACGTAPSPSCLHIPLVCFMKQPERGSSIARLKFKQQPDCEQVTTPRLDSDCNSEFGGSPDNGTPPALQGVAPSPFAGNSLEVLITLSSLLGIPCRQLCACSLQAASAGVGCCEPFMAKLLRIAVTV